RPYPLLDSRAAHRLTLRLTLPRFLPVLARHGFARVDLLWMTPGSPLLPLLEGLEHRVSVYRLSDDSPAFPDTPRSYADLEREAVRRVDLVVATAGNLVERARSLGARRVLHLPNACDPEPFLAPGLREPPDLAGVRRPRAIYVGAIDGWFDVELLAGAARLAPEWSFVLLGPARADLGPLRGAGNVRALGPRPYADLPAYLRAADAGLVPFRRGPLSDSIHPIKLYEYCAAGLPVVATPMRETASLGAPVRLAGDAAGLVRALRESVREGPAARQERVAFARRHTWDRRFAALRTELRACGLSDATPARQGRASGGGG
ncbi:MAG: glycosyltransferase, partial [Acidobacteriota bacterium]